LWRPEWLLPVTVPTSRRAALSADIRSSWGIPARVAEHRTVDAMTNDAFGALEDHDDSTAALIARLRSSGRAVMADLSERAIVHRFADAHDAADRLEMLADTVDALRAHVAELLPLLEAEVRFGLSLGAAPAGHPSDDCADCLAYLEAVAWKARLDAGEFDYPTSSL
jgi:hypothetical protein